MSKQFSLKEKEQNVASKYSLKANYYYLVGKRILVYILSLLVIYVFVLVFAVTTKH